MEQPNHVLSTVEPVWVPKNEKIIILRNVLLLIIAVIIVGSFMFKDNFFLEFTFTTQMILAALMMSLVFLAGGYNEEASPIEVRFFDDHMVIYRPKRFYSKKVTRKEINTLYYKDIKKIVFKQEARRIKIYGMVNFEWYNYDKNGEVSVNPNIVRKVNSMVHFYTKSAPDIDFIAEIEKNTPINVTIQNY